MANWKLVKEAEEKYFKEENTDYIENLKIFEELWKEAVKLGVIPLKNPLEDIEVKIKLAKCLNYVRRTNIKNSTIP